MENSNYYSKTDKIDYVETSHETEKELFRRFYAGDPEDMSNDALAARDAIIQNNLRYALMIALRKASARKYHADLTSCANAGLIEALESRRFDPSRGRFTTFATKFILGKINAYFRVSCSVSFPANCLPDWPEDGIEPDVETLSDPHAFDPAQIDHEALHRAIDTLPSTERQMIEHIFFNGENVSSAAALIVRDDGKVGVGRQWATDLRNRALVKLRLAMGVPQKVENGEVELEQEAA
jgi:RNA polymerase sigma factor (sigma-70 family)